MISKKKILKNKKLRSKNKLNLRINIKSNEKIQKNKRSKGKEKS